MMGLAPFEEVARKVYWDMAIYDQESMEMLIKRVGADRVLFATEMFGAVNATDPQTGRSFEDVRSMFDNIDWLTDVDRQNIFEGNARQVYGKRLPVAAG
jgi:4-oxalmesaconate hydratase